MVSPLASSLPFAVLLLLAVPASSQLPGKQKPDAHPALEVQYCTTESGCATKQQSVVLDSNWMWAHKSGSSTNCFTGNSFDPALCPTPEACAANCALDSGDVQGYKDTYGVSTEGSSLNLQFVTKGPYSTDIGSRLYLLESDDAYQLFRLKNREFTFDADVSALPCGLNGALYFVEMDADGGLSKYPGNKAGAKYGTGYCDAQCPHDLKFIDGEANSAGWAPSPKDKNAGVGKYGTCCSEMDIWEANSLATALTPHPCTVKGQTRCEGKDCGDDAAQQRYDGVCDKDGCDANPFRLGQPNFFGPGASYTVDTSMPVTVVTQFLTADGTDSGALSEIRRLYVQGGHVIKTDALELPGGDGATKYDSVTDAFCTAQKQAFGNPDEFAKKGGMAAMGEAMARGMVLVMSLWDDHDVDMLWLDSNDPADAPASTPGVARGPCSTSSGKPADVEANHGDAHVSFSNIKFGDIGSTFAGTPAPAPAPPTPTPPTPTPTPPAPTPSPSPSGCPGGSLSACMGVCPSSPAVAYQACVRECVKRCTSPAESGEPAAAGEALRVVAMSRHLRGD